MNKNFKGSQINEVEYAPTHASQASNLHVSSQHVTMGSVSHECSQNNNINSTTIPGILPKYTSVNKPSTLAWGRGKDGNIIYITDTTILEAYEEITTWKKNVFLVPYGKIGRDFIDQITLHINEWNNNTDNQHIALKAAIVLLAACLQKPSIKSKAKDHQNILAKRLALWKDGGITKLIHCNL